VQIEITPQIVIATVGIGFAVQSAIVAVAVMIRGTSKDLARESKEREDAEKATETRFVLVERDVRQHAIALHGLEVRTQVVERTVDVTATTIAGHAQELAALAAAARADDRRRR